MEEIVAGCRSVNTHKVVAENSGWPRALQVCDRNWQQYSHKAYRRLVRFVASNVGRHVLFELSPK